MTKRIALGIDVGTTECKVLATALDGQELEVRSTPTRWRNGHGGQVSIDPWHLVDGAIDLAAEVTRATAERWGPIEVGAVGITGMAESGVLLDMDGSPRNDVIAWFDPRGDEQIRSIPADLASDFAAVTGLPLGSQVTIAKLLWLRDQGVRLLGAQWLHVPELIAFRLAGARGSEPSLLARTGLLDQESGDLWLDALDYLAADDSVFPDRTSAGAPLGIACGEHCPAELRGAVVTVAGHDHPVAAIGCGADGPGVIFDSFGTAEVFLRSLDSPLTAQRRTDMVGAGINVVRGVLAGRWHLLAGTKSGLLMRRTLALLGVGRDDRQRLDNAAVIAADVVAAHLDLAISGAANDDGMLRIAASSDDVSPAALWLAVVRHGIEAGNALLSTMCADDDVMPPAVVAGGWVGMASVRNEKRRQLPDVRFSSRTQAGAFGAAALAASALTRSQDYGTGAPDIDLVALAAFVHSARCIDERIAG